MCSPLRERIEKSYSAPLAMYAFSREVVPRADGRMSFEYPRLRVGGAQLRDPSERGTDIARRIGS